MITGLAAAPGTAPGTDAASPVLPATSPEAAAVVFERASKTYGHAGGAVPALDEVSLAIAPGEFVCLLGASGCGKSTLLNLAAGLDRPTSGSVSVRGRTALMFQESALFPWLTVRGNVELPMRLAGVRKAERRRRAHDLLRLVHLHGVDHRLVHELSGGMRQRVALARALAQDADVLLMDEPFGALDAMTRDLLHDELEQVWVQRSLTVVFVTHNVREAVRLGDRVVLLTSRPGRVAAEFRVALDRPRSIESHGVADLAAAITTRLREEVRRHGDDAA